MRCSVRFIFLLILSIALRAFSGAAYALPSSPDVPMQMAECAESGQHEMPAVHSPHHSNDKACQISCDLAVSPALPVDLAVLGETTQAVLSATFPILAMIDAVPPDIQPPRL